MLIIKKLLGEAVFLMAGALFLTVPALSKNDSSKRIHNTCCVCETDSRISHEVPFYKAGCSLWLASQKNCVVKATFEGGDQFRELSLPESCRGGVIKWGYVGHGFDLNQKISRSVLPTAQHMQTSVEMNDTSCDGMNRPDSTQNLLSQISKKLKRSQYLKIQGNQTISVGMWEKFMPGKENFYAVADTRIREIALPSCAEFEKKYCHGKYQDSNMGLCVDEKTKMRRSLMCERKTEQRYVSDPKGHVREEKFSIWRWRGSAERIPTSL